MPHDIAERAALAYYGADCLAYRRSKAVPELPPQHEHNTDLAGALAEHTGHDVVAGETTIPQIGAAGLRVVRIVAPGAYQLPGREPPGLNSPPHPIC